MGYGITDNMQTKSEEDIAAEDEAWAVPEIVKSLQVISGKQIETYKAKMHEMLKKLITTAGNSNKSKRQNGGPNHGHECPHCKCHHPKMPDNKCWELEVNLAQCPANWVLLKDRPRKAT